MTLVGAIDAYANRPTGIVVFDSTRPESVDIATMIAAQKNGILVGSDLVAWLQARTGLPVLFDYASSDWASLDAIAAFDRALRDLYPSSATTRPGGCRNSGPSRSGGQSRLHGAWIPSWSNSLPRFSIRITTVPRPSISSLPRRAGRATCIPTMRPLRISPPSSHSRNGT